MSIKIFHTSLMLLLASNVSVAKVSQDQAAKLANELTPIGAQVSGNKSGSIPAYSGGLSADEEVDSLTNIYADELPLFTITSKNVKQYQANLSDGQLALFKKYPDTYKMPIYQTHRTAAYPQYVYDKAMANATTTQLVDGGAGLTGFDETVPFALPQNGLEVVWNHVSRYRGGSVERNSALLSVQKNGEFMPVKIRGLMTPPQYLSDGYDGERDENILFYFVEMIKSPTRYTGNVFLVHETIDQLKQPRKAWAYNAGQRRVRRAPQVAYDAPAQGTEGLRTTDQLDMFNGAPDRYNWQLEGKKEVYIPYNAYKMADPTVKYENMVNAGHINQDHTRYELHRVWQVTATLKDDARHVYAKRTFYVDEDSWQIVLADHYDNRGELWRTSEGHSLQFVNAKTTWYVALTHYDLISGRYIANLSNEERNAFEFNSVMGHGNFTTGAIRRLGKL